MSARRSIGILVGAIALPIAVAHPAIAQSNATMFALICASSIGFSNLDRNACAQGDFDTTLAGVSAASILGSVYSGSNVGRATVVANFLPDLLSLPPSQAYPIVRLNRDPGDGPPSGPFDSASLSYVLTDEQEALLGCGPLWGTDCDSDGIDLINAELSVLLQSWPGFRGATPGSRWENGQLVVLPGARGPGQAGYVPSVDGCTGPTTDPLCELAQPLATPTKAFANEMAALSWNFLMTLVAFSQAPAGEMPETDELDPSDPMRTGAGLCSFAQPQFCSSVRSIVELPPPTGAADLADRTEACTAVVWKGGFGWSDYGACGAHLFGSAISMSTGMPLAEPKAGDSIASLLANAIAGNALARAVLESEFTGGAVIPFVALNEDPCDAWQSDAAGGCQSLPDLGSNPTWTAGGVRTLSQLLSGEQEALLGCGQFWQTDCEGDGLDLLDADVSVVIQSWTGISGDYGDGFLRTTCPSRPSHGAPPCPDISGLVDYCIGCRDPDDGLLPVPGTVAFDGITPAARYTDEGIVQSPGARGPTDPGYDLEQDGSAEGLSIPMYDDPARGIANGFGDATGLPFRSELAALSWNALMTLVALSGAVDPDHPEADELDPANPARTGPGLCSFRQPQFCRVVFPAPEPDAPLAGIVAIAACVAVVRRRGCPLRYGAYRIS